MVTSEQVFEFVKDLSTVCVTDDDADYSAPSLANEDLADALDVIARIVEAETHAALTREQMKIMLSRVDGGPNLGPLPGTPIPVAN